MIKQKLIELRPDYNDYTGILSIMKKKVIDYYQNNEINQEDIEKFTSSLPFFTDAFYILTENELIEFEKRNNRMYIPKIGKEFIIEYKNRISEKRDDEDLLLSMLIMLVNKYPKRAQAISYYLQEFLDDLNEKDAEIIQITSIQDDTWDTGYNASGGGASYTQGILVVYKEK